MADIAGLLKKAPIFSDFGQRDLRRITRMARVRTYRPGDVIVKEGTVGVGVFIISSGKVEVVQRADTPSASVLATLGPGEIFGEMAVIENYPRNATVRAADNSECVVIARADFMAELRTRPEIAVKLLRVLVRRLREAEAKPTE